MNSNLLEYMMLQQLTGGGGGAAGAHVWLQVAMLVCLFLAGLYRPDVVRAKPLFRLACVLFALSLLVSPTLNFLLGYLLSWGGGPGPGFGQMGGETAIIMSFPTMISAILFGLSVICGLSSLGLGAASSAAAKAPQSMGRLPPQPMPPTGLPEPAPRPRTAPPSGVHPLDEPD
jgi:hypothetical protein